MQESKILKSVYGPVKSWRYGTSLGVDPILVNSICNFNCIYCQLGRIRQRQSKREIFVSKEKLENDLKEFLNTKQDFDLVCFSGSGEPTLAKNLKELAQTTKSLIPNKELVILTNAGLLSKEDEAQDLCCALESFDRVVLKLDAESKKHFLKINRPALNTDYKKVIEGILNFKKKGKAKLELQSMFLAGVDYDIKALSQAYNALEISPVYINTPSRSHPKNWNLTSRGNHEQLSEVMTLDKDALVHIYQTLKKNSLNIDFIIKP